MGTNELHAHFVVVQTHFAYVKVCKHLHLPLSHLELIIIFMTVK
jgi:hypothetical protein